MEGVAGTIAQVLARDTEQAASALREDGVVLVEGLWPRETISQAHTLIAQQHPEFGNGELPLDKIDSGKGRFIAPVRISREMCDLGLAGHPGLEALLGMILGPGFVHEAFGLKMARAGCPEQHLHRDTDPLFPETGIDRLLPPTVLTIAIPLVDIGQDNGPTAFAIGSHRNEPGEDMSLVSCEVPMGSALIWDFRVVHRGCANRSTHDRPMLYYTTTRPFWFDHKNFRSNGRRLIADSEVIGDLGESFVRAAPA